jgi:hypothetical protein
MFTPKKKNIKENEQFVDINLDSPKQKNSPKTPLKKYLVSNPEKIKKQNWSDFSLSSPL